MALVVEFYCSICGCGETMAIPSGAARPNVCNACRQKEKSAEKRQYFSGLDGLTIEERLRKIELWIYEYKLETRTADMKF